MYLPDLVSYLDACLPEYEQERKDTKEFIAKLLYLPTRHYDDSSAVSISRAFLQTLGHSQALFSKVNIKYGFYTTDNQYFQGKSTRKYYPTHRVTQLLSGFQQQSHSYPIKELKHYGNKAKLVDAHYIAGECIELSGTSIKTSIRCDVTKLGHFLKQCDNDMWVGVGYRFTHLLHSSNYPYGVAPQAYKAIPNGRVVGCGVSVQNSPKLLREALMDGSYDYDFTNCHYSVLSQTGDFPSLSAYVANTADYRATIAQDLGVTPKQVKTALIAMLYGANKGTNAKFSAIPSIIGEANVQAFWKHPLVASIKSETTEAGILLLNEAPSKGFYSKLSFQLQSIEKSILSAATQGIDVDVPMYDGFIYSDKLDTKLLQKNIKDATGYSVSVKRERIHYAL